jgi:ubiquinone/menaquinone biosynthesis C-methylase UbiE
MSNGSETFGGEEKGALRRWDAHYLSISDSFLEHVFHPSCGDRNYQRERYFFGRVREQKGTLLILDVGCGPALYLKSLVAGSSSQLTFIGIDESLQGLLLARSRNSAGAYVQGRMPGLPIRPHTVDILFCFGVLMYISQWPVALSELGSILKPGGELMLYERLRKPSISGWLRPWKKESLMDGRCIDEASLRMALQEIGDIELWVKDYSPVRYLLVQFLRRWMDRSQWVTKCVVGLDTAVIGTIGRILPLFDGRCVFVTLRKTVKA